MWWLRLGIQIERIRPGHPEQNGRHERIHLTLKTDATKPAAANTLQQQARFDTRIQTCRGDRLDGFKRDVNRATDGTLAAQADYLELVAVKA